MAAVELIPRLRRHIELADYPTEWWDLERDRMVPPPHDVGRCWRWKGKTDEKGYGRFMLDGVTMQAHKAVWIVIGRKIRKGCHLDHRCRRVWCVNPRHLQQVTPTENNRRARRARSGSDP